MHTVSKLYSKTNMSDRADVIVVGGGIVGMSCAYYLQQAGRKVSIVDRGRYAEAASTGNAGLIVPSHIIPLSAPGVIAKGMKWLMNPESPLYIKPSANPHFMKWLWLFQKHCSEAHVQKSIPVLKDMSLLSRDLLSEMCSLPGFEKTSLVHNGLLMLHRSESAQKDNEELADIAEAAGLEIERLDHAQTLNLEPALKSEITGSVYFKQDASLEPEQLLRALEIELRSQGVSFIDAEVTGFKTNRGAVTSVTTKTASLECDTVVLAAGSWTPILGRKLGHSISVQPAKGYSVTIPVDSPSLRIPCIATDEKVSITPMPGCIRFGGTLALQGFDDSIDERRVAPIRRQAGLYCSDMDDIPTWSGFRPASPDGIPFIGALPTSANTFMATGHGMMGVTLGPVTGKLITELIVGDTPSLKTHPFRTDRH